MPNGTDARTDRRRRLQARRPTAPIRPGTPRGGLVVAQEIFGVNSHIRSVCDGFAADGYVAIAPALFDRYERGVDIGYTPADIVKGRELKALAQIDAAMRDIAAARDAVAGAGKVGVIGYCWGGFVAWMAASRLPGFACAVPYYGGGMLDAAGERPQCPVMAHFGERDAMIPGRGRAQARRRASRRRRSSSTTPTTASTATSGRPTTRQPRSSRASARSQFLRRHIG